MIQIIPAVLATTEEQYKADIYKLAASETLSEGWIHIDFADNKFVPNNTVNIETITKFPVNFYKEAHLMVTHPKDWIDKLASAGFERIIFHIESEDNILELINEIKSKDLEVGLAVNKDTPVDNLVQYVDKINVVLIMTIVAGFQGQPFISDMLEKVKEIKSHNWDIKVGVDGAVKDVNIKQIIKSGVDFVTIGSYLLKGDVDENLEILWEEINAT